MAIIGALGAIVGGVMGFAQASYQAKVADVNADIAKDNATRARQTAAIKQEDNDRQTAALLGQQEAAQASSGVSLTGRSQVLTRRSARMLGRLDALNIVQGGALDAYNYETQSMNFKAQAAGDRLTGLSNLVGGFFSAGSSLVGSASQPNRFGQQGLIS